MNTREYVTLQVERTRGQLRATAFLRLGDNSLALRGKPLSEFSADLLKIGKKPVELIDAEGALDAETEPFEGDIVSAWNAFSDNDGMVWEGTNLCFRAPNGAAVSPSQYEYLKEQPLSVAQIFAETEKPMQRVKSTWKSMARTAREARNDKAKEIFYLSFGELIWEVNKGKKDARKVKSPLLIMPIKEETIVSDTCKFKISEPVLKQNSVLRREVLKQTGVNIYEGCAEEIFLQDVVEALAQIVQTVCEYVDGMHVETDAYHICILDSHDEGVCQAVEKNIDAIADSPLTRILADDLALDADGGEAAEETAVIFPLPADESQKKVVDLVLKGQSVYAPAPAGAGKSQTSVNIAANLAIQGKSICVMSEKLAANEVFLDYAAKIGLDKYCLSVNSSMKTADIVRQIKAIAKIRRQYVRTSQAKEAVQRYSDALREYAHLNGELYRTDPLVNASLYELIEIAVTAPEIPSLCLQTSGRKEYTALRSTLLEIQSGCFEIMTDREFEAYFYYGTCADPELQVMLSRALGKLAVLGMDLSRTVRESGLTRTNAVRSILASLARRIALEMIGEKDLNEAGNRRVKAMYKFLVDTHLRMQELYVSYLHQELTARIEDNIDDTFVSVLEKLKVTKVTPQELFGAYGKEILSICPIIITTPTAAANYIYDTGLDDFHTMIIDEASQMQIISLLPYADRTKQLVVFGDAMQLGITSTFMKKDLVTPEDPVKNTAYTDRSVLQAVQGRLPSCGLKYHYRSGTEMLIHVSNKTCYDGLLEVIPDIYTDRSALPKHLGLEVIQVAPPDPPTPKGGNESEAREIAQRVISLQDEYPDKSIGIIALNNKQQERIADVLEETVEGYVDSDRLWVRSLENAQGKEADFIFISIGHYRRNQDGSIHKTIAEINRAGGENRLNVLFTRARCKNFIVISFDYRELKKSDNVGIRRLYEYMDYAVNGSINEASGSRSGNADHAMIQRMAEMLEMINPSYKTGVRLGSDSMTVDIAVKEDGKSCYSLGVLMPSFELTPQETMTKVLVLEKGGWHISPVSPIYFLLSPDAFRMQIERDLKEPITFTAAEHACFDTYKVPDVLFCGEDLLSPREMDYEAEATAITVDDFLAIDFASCYAEVLREGLWQKDVKELNALAKGGDTEANLVLLILLRDRFVNEGKWRSMLSNVNRLYSVQSERRAGFLLAQMLRVGEIGNNRNLIKNLFREAYELGIGGE